MKKIITLCVALCATVATFAQQQMAILSHNDSLSAYYGVNAFIDAYSAAVTGDMITLSSGTFTVNNISKAITIRGNGFEEDTIAGTRPTILKKSNGPIQMNVPSDSIHSLIIEGIKFSSNTAFVNLYSPQFIKCKFAEFYASGSNSNAIMTDAFFSDCVMNELSLSEGMPQATHRNTNFVNCVILSIINRAPNNCNMFNCIAGLANSKLTTVNADGPAYTCTNCILYSNAPSNVTNNTSYCTNCIGINTGSDTSLSYFSNTQHGNRNFFRFQSVFKYYRGSLSNGVTYELLDSIANTIVGTDGTEIGVYGGMLPFTSRVNTSRYIRCNVAPHTTLDGKLSVDIEVVTE